MPSCSIRFAVVPVTSARYNVQFLDNYSISLKTLSDIEQYRELTSAIFLINLEITTF